MRKGIVIDTDTFVVGHRNNTNVPNLAHLWTRSEAETLFGLVVPSDITLLNYQPYEDMYLITRDFKTVESFKAPQDHVLMNWCHENIDTVIHEAENALLPFHTFVDGEWVINQPEQDEMDRRTRVGNNLRVIRQNDRFLLRIIAEMYQVGKAKGLWSASDFDANLLQKAQTLRQAVVDNDVDDPDGSLMDEFRGND
jgi:hypothetical protein